MKTKGKKGGQINLDFDFSSQCNEKAEENFVSNDSFLNSILNAVQDGMMILDTDLTIIKINQWMETRFADRMPLVGRKCHEIYQGRASPCQICPSLKTLENGEPHTEIIPLPLEGNDEKWIELSSFPITDEKGQITGMIEYIKDVTEKKRIDDERQERVKELTCLYALSRDIQKNLPTDDLCQRAVDYIIPAMQHPELAGAIIELEEGKFTSGKFSKDLSHGLYSDITVEGLKYGKLWVYYTQEIPFIIPEEQDLINSIAEALGALFERKKAENERKRDRSLLVAALESTADGILVVDRDGKWSSFNQKFVEMWKIPPSIFEAGDDGEALDYVYNMIADPEKFVARVQELYEDPERDSFDVIELKDGRIFERYSQPQRLGSDIVGRVWSFRDVTIRKRAEEALKKSESLLSRSQSISLVGSWEMDLEADDLTWSEEVYRIFGMEPQKFEPSYTAFLDAVHPEDRILVDNAYSDSLRENQDKYEVEHRIIHRKTGEVRFVHEKCEHIKDNEGKIIRSIGMVQDITERKKFEIALEESQRRLSTLMSNLPGMVYRCSNETDWPMELASEGCSELTGYKPEDFINGALSFGDIIHEEDRQRVWDEVQDALNSSRPFQITYRINTAMGEQKWVMDEGRGIYGSEGEILALEGFISDIDFQKKAEEALRESEENYKFLFHNIDVGVGISNADGRVLAMNNAMSRITGYSMKDYENVDVRDTFFDLEERERYSSILRNDRKTEAIELRFRRKNGEIYWASISSMPIRFDGERAYLTTKMDITPQKKAEEMIKTEKANAEFYLDLFHHDIGNIHQGIYGSLQLMKRKVSDNDDHLNDALDLPLEAVKRAILLSKDVRVLSHIRSEEKNFHPIDLKECLMKTIDQVKGVFPKKEIEVQKDLFYHSILAEPLIGQLFFNLLHNAVKLQWNSPWIRVVMEELSNGIRIIISDKGPGIDDEMKKVLFDTDEIKRKGSRTGLGLLIVKELIDRYNGRIEVRNRVEGDRKSGTTFIIDFNSS